MKKKEFKRSAKLPMKKIFEAFKGSRIILIISLIMAGIGAALTIIGPNKIGDMTEYMSQGLFGEINLAEIARLGLVLLAIYLSSGVCIFIQQYFMASATLKFSKKLRGNLSKKINKVPQKYFSKVPQGEVLSRITNDVSTLQQSLSNSLPTIVSAGAQFVGCLIMMFVTEWRLALCTIGVTFIGIIVMGIVVKRSQKYFVARQKNLGQVNGYIEEMYSGHDVVRISRAGTKIKNDFVGLNENMYKSEWKSQFFSGLMHPIMHMISNLGYVVVCVVGASLALSGIIGFGVIVSFILYARLFTTPLIQIAQATTNLQTASATSHRIFDFLEAEELSDETGLVERMKEIKGEIEFKNVKFSYPDAPDKIIISDFSAKIKPGQKVAIVGPTGAGKTTIVNLLMKFYELNSGQIYIDGKPLNDLKRECVHDLFSMVLQDTWLFEGTVKENLVYNLKNVTDEKIEKVCKECGIDAFIKSLPHGFDTVLSEDTAISAGQKQLFTIARAMLQNSPMLILDEATSSVDTRTELIIQNAMDNLMHGRTSFVIAHRLSTIKNADIILVLKDGDIIEKGTHEDLLKQKGFYADLYNSQFEMAE